MAQSSWPSPDDSRVVSDLLYEQLVATQYVDGQIGSPTDTPLIFAIGDGRQVVVRANRFAQLRGHGWTSGATDVTLTIGANSSGSTRTDLVVLGLNRSTWNVRAYVKAGTPGSGAPALQTDPGGTGTGIYEIPLAEVTVLNGASVISSAQVKIRHWYVRADGSASAGADTRPPSPAVGAVTTEGADKLAWNGSYWQNLTSPPAPVQSSQVGSLAGSAQIDGNEKWHDFPSATWAPLVFTVPPSGRAFVTITGLAINTVSSTATIWMSWRASGGGLTTGTDSPTVDPRAITSMGTRVGASKRRMYTGLTPGAPVTLTPIYYASAASSNTSVTQLHYGQLIVEPIV
jgi:hypothetical protein